MIARCQNGKGSTDELEYIKSKIFWQYFAAIENISYASHLRGSF